MTSATEAQVTSKAGPPRGAVSKGSARRRGGRRLRNQGAESARYFVGHPADPECKPTLEQEVASEPEALVIAFKGDSRVYLVLEYRVTERIEDGQVRLEKEQVLSTHGFLPSTQVE